jgi:flagellar hook assembly protein FlgD
LFAGSQAGGMYRWSLNIGVEEEGRNFENRCRFTSLPNPFTSSTEISFQLSKDEDVNLCIYDIQGRLIKVLINDIKRAGTHNVAWHGLDKNNNRVTAGVYFCKFTTEQDTYVQKLLLLK